ncbi:MAG: glycosyltransferase family 39 protein [Myxococcales bacterium]|nr:glycosyltransferase family 39 protein [Myxococcales bacterium]
MSAYVALLFRTARHLGFARDEGFYFAASTSYARWFDLLLRNRHEALTRTAIDQAWNINHEHPSLMKSLFGLSWLFLHEKWHLIAQESLSFRLPGMVMGGLGLWLVYLFGYRLTGRHRVGLMAAALLGLMPRVFYHAHLDCFDVPVMTMWVAVLYCHWRSLDGGFGWSLATGVMWGLCLETKHNAWFVPILVVVHWLVTRGGEFLSASRRGNFPLPLSLPMMALLGPVIFVGLWPWMWFDTLATPDGHPGRFSEYANFHLHHAYYNMEYLGFNWFRPPFPRSYAWGMIVFTVPAITLLLGLLGVSTQLTALARELSWLPSALAPARSAWGARLKTFADAWPEDRRGSVSFLLLGFAVPLGPWLSPKTPIFGGTKHWFPAYPFLALFAGLGFWALSRLFEAWLGERVTRTWLAVLCLGAALVLPAFSQTAHSHPFGLSNYTPLAGGAPGGADLGLNRQFWGFTTASLVPYFNAQARPGASVYIHDTTWDSWVMMQRDGYLRGDLRAVWQPAEADFSIVHHELHMNEVDYQNWVTWQSPRVAEVLTYDGVPIVSVYRRP